MQIYFLEPMVADYFKFINKLPHNFGDKNLKSMCQMDSAPLRVAEGACFPLSELPVLAGHLWYYVAWSCTIPLFLLTLSYVIILYFYGQILIKTSVIMVRDLFYSGIALS